MQKIRTLSTFAMILMLPMMLYYPYQAMVWNLNLSFLDQGAWTRNDVWVDVDAQIATATRVVFFVVWTIPVVLGSLSYLLAFMTLVLVRQGIVFDYRVARRLRLLGIFVFSSSVSSLLGGAISPMIRSWHNADGPLALRFWYNSSEIGMAFCGLAFLFWGIVMREAIRIARENEEFI
ncbi:hypothetical protein [uncultured Sulfitobacter sp.]|uniref:hypothetical protein n=1 Tax=uncultured Sulfitobacter sp. TaxID=191468 RepID=UPI0026191342|nr:hypothetical protein [uncultured Sulfitobacter sp.]